MCYRHWFTWNSSTRASRYREKVILLRYSQIYTLHLTEELFIPNEFLSLIWEDLEQTNSRDTCFRAGYSFHALDVDKLLLRWFVFPPENQCLQNSHSTWTVRISLGCTFIFHECTYWMETSAVFRSGSGNLYQKYKIQSPQEYWP